VFVKEVIAPQKKSRIAERSGSMPRRLEFLLERVAVEGADGARRPVARQNLANALGFGGVFQRESDRFHQKREP